VSGGEKGWGGGCTSPYLDLKTGCAAEYGYEVSFSGIYQIRKS